MAIPSAAPHPDAQLIAASAMSCEAERAWYRHSGISGALQSSNPRHNAADAEADRQSDLLIKIKPKADQMPLGEDSDIARLAHHAESLAGKLKDELVELDTALRAAGWAG